jgi:hypothetical protein
MASKQVTDRQKSTRAVAAAADKHADEIGSHLGAMLSPHLQKGETMPDVALLARLVGRLVAVRCDALVAADRAHEAELSDDSAPREARDEAADHVRQVLVDLRSAVDTLYGAAGLTKLRLAAPVPTDPQVLATAGGNVLEALEDATVKLAKPSRAGLKLDRQAFADDLSAEIPKLQAALKVVAREAREAEATLLAKTRAMADNDRDFSRGADLLSALAEAGGLDDLGKRVRPSGRRPGQTASSDPAPGDGSAADGPSGEKKA